MSSLPPCSRNVPEGSIRDYRPLPPPGEQYPLPFIRSRSLLKLTEAEQLVRVGVCEPPTEELRIALESFHRKQVDFVRIEPSDLAAYVGRLALSTQIPAPDRGVGGDGYPLDRLANDAPIVNFVNGLLIDAVRLGASDLHLEGDRREARVRYRIDGMLSTAETFDPTLLPAISTRIKIMANLNIMERRLPQDGRVTVHLEGRALDIRVSTVPSQRSESVVIRLFSAKINASGLGVLGLQERDRLALRRLVQRPSGLLLVTGPTGSGKSSTLNALLRELETSERKLVSIEDPIEQLVPGVVQIQTNDRLGLTFDRLLRHVLRQDPNVVMVGEIRDSATAELVIRAGLTGHLILTTLHTRGAISAAARLRNLGVPPYLIAEVLNGSVAQRLVRKLCPRCKRESGPSESLQRISKSHGIRIDRTCRPVGCDECRGTGFAGRLPLMEIFVVDERSREMIAEGRSTAVLSAHQRRGGMRTLFSEGLRRIADGMTTIEEVGAVVAAE